MSAQDLEQRARELLAEKYRRIYEDAFGGPINHFDVLVSVIADALRHQPAPVVDDAMRELIQKWRKLAEQHGVRTFTGNDHALFANELEAALARAGGAAVSLAHLSIQHVTAHRRPRVPSNEERIKAFRAYQPVHMGNAMFAQRYAAEAVPGASYEQDLREGFALKYGSTK